MVLSIPIDAILVPQGAEYKAVCRGLSRVNTTKPLVIQIPVGPKSLASYLDKLKQEGHLLGNQPSRVLLMGLCGSLSPQHAIGDIVLYQECVEELLMSTQRCDRPLTNLIQQQLNQSVSLVRALTSDRLIWDATQKRELGKIHAASVVDMEGSAALEALSLSGSAVAMIRVVSDDCHHNLPDLTLALSDGSLQAFPLFWRLLRQPLAAARLIRGGLRGLQVLQRVTTCLFLDC